MRKAYFLAGIVGCALALGLSVQAQETNILISPPKTKFENFQLKANTVLIRGSTQAGSLQTRNGLLIVRSEDIREPATGLFEQALSIEVRLTNQPEEGTIVDYDEIEGLIVGVDYLTGANPAVTQLAHFDVSYRTRGDLLVRAFNHRSSAIEASVQSGRYNHSTALLSMEELARFRALLDQAKAKLDAIRKK